MHGITVLFNKHLDNDYDPYTATFLKQCLTAKQNWNDRNKGKTSIFKKKTTHNLSYLGSGKYLSRCKWKNNWNKKNKLDF